MALSIMPSKDELQKLVTNMTTDINLSLKQAGSIPDTLSSGPWTINYLNQLRLLAYSSHVQRVTLKPREGEPFKHIKYPDLSPAIVQVVNSATNAFHVAHNNMNLVQMQARALFGNTGLAQDVLVHLQTPDGGQSAMYALGGLKDGMNRCSTYMDKICTAFGEVIETASELELALTKEAADNQKRKDRLEIDQSERKVEVEIEKYFLEEHKKQLEKGEESLREARKVFKKTAKHSELKVLGVKALSDVQGFVSGTLGAAVNIVKETPHIALTGLKAFGNLGNILSGGERDLFDCGNSTEAVNPVAATADPGLQSASEIESQLSRLQNIFEDDLLKMLQGGKIDDLRDCVAQMRATSGRLGDGPYSQTAADVLKKGITFGEIVLGLQPKASSIDPEGKDWNDKLRKWQVLFDNIQGKLLHLKATAAIQAGQGFGNNASSCPSDLNGVNLQSLMALRHNKLLMMETAMKNAEDNVRKITRQNQATQTKMIQLAHQMKQLDHSKAKLEDTKKILVEAMEVLYEIKNGFNRIRKFFDLLAGYIVIQINDKTFTQLTHAMESAKGRMSDADMMCYQIKARTIVDLVLQMRGHFMFVYDMAKLYTRISQDYIVPCIEHMGSLKVSKLATSDQQAAEKAYIDDFTTKCSQAIIKIAQADMEKFQKDMKARCMEIREESELQGLDRLVSQSHRATIEDAMSQASDRIIEQETSRIEDLEKKIEKSSETIINDTCFD